MKTLTLFISHKMPISVIREGILIFPKDKGLNFVLSSISQSQDVGVFAMDHMQHFHTHKHRAGLQNPRRFVCHVFVWESALFSIALIQTLSQTY